MGNHKAVTTPFDELIPGGNNLHRRPLRRGAVWLGCWGWNSWMRTVSEPNSDPQDCILPSPQGIGYSIGPCVICLRCLMVYACCPSMSTDWGWFSVHGSRSDCLQLRDMEQVGYRTMAGENKLVSDVGWCDIELWMGWCSRRRAIRGWEPLVGSCHLSQAFVCLLPHHLTTLEPFVYRRWVCGWGVLWKQGQLAA